MIYFGIYEWRKLEYGILITDAYPDAIMKEKKAPSMAIIREVNNANVAILLFKIK